MPAQSRAQAPVPAFAKLAGDVQGRLPGASFAPLRDLRTHSLDRFTTLGIPTTRHEAWRYTNVGKLANVAMGLAPRSDVGAADVLRYALGGTHARRMIFVDGHLVSGLSHIGSLPAGMWVGSLASALEAEPESVTATLANVDDDRSFTALNGAFVGAGAWIELDDGVVLDEPLQLLFLTRGDASAVMSHPRLVVRLGKGTRLRLIESHAATGHGHALTNLVSQLDLADGAALIHDRVQLLDDGRTLLGKAFVTTGAGSKLDQTVASLGGALIRNESEVVIGGSGADTVLSGLYMPRASEHVDNLIRVTHAAPGSRSDQFYKGVLVDRARAVFAGKIVVERPAQKTVAYQKNDNLLLSDDAEADTKPELEIYADDVKCSHGATCGELDPLAMFYLRSRGLLPQTATALLTWAFVAEVVERFADETVRAAVRAAAIARLPGGTALELPQ